MLKTLKCYKFLPIFIYFIFLFLFILVTDIFSYMHHTFNQLKIDESN